jgi:hypothetical protein
MANLSWLVISKSFASNQVTATKLISKRILEIHVSLCINYISLSAAAIQDTQRFSPNILFCSPSRFTNINMVFYLLMRLFHRNLCKNWEENILIKIDKRCYQLKYYLAHLLLIFFNGIKWVTLVVSKAVRDL